MPQILTCQGCEQPIAEKGWRCYPARIEAGQLVGTEPIDEEGRQHRQIGDGVDLCCNCVPVPHPKQEEPEAEPPEE